MSGKTKIIGSLLAVTALWLGTTAYVSSNTENYLKNYVSKSNNMYEQYGMNFSVETFEKGFFSSKSKMKIDFVEPEIKEIVSKTFNLPLEFTYDIDNGPIFFSDGLGFGASRVTNSINLSDYLKDKEAFKKIVKDDVQIDSSTSIDFSNNASFKLTSNMVKVIFDGKEIAVSPLKIMGDMNVETFEGDMKMFVDSIVAENMALKDIILDADITKFYDNGFYLGEVIFDIGSLTIKDKNLPLELNGAKVSLQMNIDENEDETIDMKFKFFGDVGDFKLPQNYAALNKIELTYALKGTKLEGLLAFQDFTKSLQAKQQKLLLKLSSSATGELDIKALEELQVFQAQTKGDMILMMAGLLKKDSTSLFFETKMIDKEDKVSSLKMNIGYVGDEVLPTSGKALEEKFRKEFLNLLTLDFNIDLNKEYIANLPADLQQELLGQLQMGTMFGVVKDNNSSYGLEVNYKPKILMLNGHDRSDMLQMLEMGLTGTTLE